LLIAIVTEALLAPRLSQATQEALHHRGHELCKAHAHFPIAQDVLALALMPEGAAALRVVPIPLVEDLALTVIDLAGAEALGL